MKKQFLLFIIVSLLSLTIHAQSRLMVQNSEKGIYLKHTVVPKENYYSIGRMYNVPPKDLASFNNMDMNNGLQIGQTLMVPLAEYNFSQTLPGGMPVYYQVGTSEGLYRVSVNNNNVPIEKLRIWNNLSTDNIQVGANLIVGYLKAGEIISAKNVPEPTQEVVKEKPVVTKPVTEVVNEPAKQEEKSKPVETKQEAQVTEKTSSPVVQTNAASVPEAGYFTDTYSRQIQKFPVKKESSVTSGIFKTSSGWQDGKYYLLIDGVDPGMIVKVINPSNARFVYAKVLGGMSGIKQNLGYNIRMSNAAAAALGIEDEKFVVTVNY
jgi:LysM repeat protein